MSIWNLWLYMHCTCTYPSLYSKVGVSPAAASSSSALPLPLLSAVDSQWQFSMTFLASLLRLSHSGSALSVCVCVSLMTVTSSDTDDEMPATASTTTWTKREREGNKLAQKVDREQPSGTVGCSARASTDSALRWDAVGVIGSARQLQKLSSRQVEQCIYPEPINNTYTPHRTARSAQRQPCTHTKSYIYAYSINICYI